MRLIHDVCGPIVDLFMGWLGCRVKDVGLGVKDVGARVEDFGFRVFSAELAMVADFSKSYLWVG